MKNAASGLDWAGARARLEQIQNLIEQAATPPANELARVYDARAKRLAESSQQSERLQAPEMLIVFRIGEERYGFGVSEVTEVLPEYKLAPAPGAPASVAGVIQVRGDIRPVYDLKHQLGIASESQQVAGAVILMRTGTGQFGVRVDSVEEIRSVTQNDRRLPGQTAHVAWMTEDLVSVLHTEALWKRES